jgi:hypothetical protein
MVYVRLSWTSELFQPNGGWTGIPKLMDLCVESCEKEWKKPEPASVHNKQCNYAITEQAEILFLNEMILA